MLGSFALLHNQQLVGAKPIGGDPYKPRFEHLNVDDGLPRQYASVRAQDDQGFLWVASKGLTKYDGYTFKTFLHDPKDSTSINSNSITNVANSIVFSEFNGNNELWICSGQALTRLNLETEKFTRYFYQPPDSRNFWLYNIYEDKQGTLWVKISNAGLFIFDRETETFIGVPTSRWLYEDNSDTLWACGYSGKLYSFDRDSSQFIETENAASGLCEICEAGGQSITRDSFGIYWSTSQKGLFAYDPENKVLKHYQNEPGNPSSLPNNNVYALHEDGMGMLWMLCFNDGLVSFDRKTQLFARYPYDPNNPDGISTNTLWGVLKDRSDVIWMGSENGLNKWNRQKDQFKLIQHQANESNSLNSDIITSIHVHSSGAIWIGTSDGLNKYDPETNSFTLYQHSDSDTKSLSHNYIVSICEDNSGFLWVATRKNIHKFDPQSGSVVLQNRFPPPPSRATDPTIQCIASDRAGNIWVGARWRLHKVNPQTGQYVGAYLPDALAVTNINEDSKGILWIGTGGRGIIRFDPKTEVETPLLFSDNGESSLNSRIIHAVHEDRNGIIWIGTDAGLNKLTAQDEDRDIFHCSIFESEGAQKNADIMDIVEDGDGNIWISTSNGLAKFDTRTKQFRNYDENDGLASNAFSRNAVVKTEDGVLLFGGMKGITSFHPDSLRDNPHIPPVVLTDFKLFHKTVPIDPEPSANRDSGFTIPKHISRLDALEMSYRENVFSLEFAALDYRNPMKNQYAYMLEGFNEDWTYVDASKREAIYTNLYPGEYVFRVKGSNNDGLWNEEGVSLAITITPPWWQSKTAYLGYFILVIAAFTIFYRIRLAQVQLQYQAQLDHIEAERYHEIDELKSRFFANISHEFRTPLTLILGPIGKLLARASDPDSEQDLTLMQRQAKRLLDLVTQLLDLSKLEAGRMEIQVSRRNIVPLLKGLTLSFASLAERDKITFSFNSELEDIQVFVEKEAITRIINNLLSNAFKFTQPGGSIQVNVTTRIESDLSAEGEILISVTDDGIGIPAERIDKIFDRFYQVDNGETREREGTGIGLALTRELVELHKGFISVTSGAGEGTTFSIRLPLGQTHLSATDIIGTEDEHPHSSNDDQIPFEGGLPPSVEVADDDSQPILLIVEDNTDVRRLIRSYLDEQYRCYEAMDGEDGLAQALDLIPDIIISDVMMPEMDGVEFCRQIKTDERTSHIPVILLTAKADLESKLEGLETGAADYLTKPFEAEELMVRIKNLIQQRDLLRKRFHQDLNLIPEDLNLSSMDQQFLKKATEIIDKHIQDFDFNVDLFSAKMFMSRQHLNRKLKAFTGRPTVDFIRSVRLKRAAILLQHHESTITQIAYKVGFVNPSHFTTSFQKQFGKSPREYMGAHRKSQGKV